MGHGPAQASTACGRLPASAVSLESGAAARLKTFSIAGEAEPLAAALAALTGHAHP